MILKIVTRDQWAVACNEGVFKGAPVDLADGYIHFSAPEQVKETAAKHFAGQDDLLLVGCAAALLDGLKWEVSRGGAEFPHLYGTFAPNEVLWVQPLPLGEDGAHIFPQEAGVE